MARPTLSHGLSPQLLHGTTYGCLALGGLCWFTYSGPYRWLAELQLGWFEVYYATYTWIGASLLLMMPALFALQAARMAGLLDTVEDSRAKSQASAQVLAGRVQHYRLPLFVLFLGACFLFMGGRNYLRGRRGRALESLDIQALEAGKRPASTWVEITGGTALWDASMAWEDDHVEHVYVPVLSEGWKQGEPVGLLLELRPYEQADAQQAEVFRGATYEFRLPGPVRTAYVEAGYPVDEALIVNLNVAPSAHQDSDLQFCFLGVGVMCLGLGLGYSKRRAELAA